jgi:hypothetical protein
VDATLYILSFTVILHATGGAFARPRRVVPVVDCRVGRPSSNCCQPITPNGEGSSAVALRTTCVAAREGACNSNKSAPDLKRGAKENGPAHVLPSCDAAKPSLTTAKTVALHVLPFNFNPRKSNAPISATTRPNVQRNQNGKRPRLCFVEHPSPPQVFSLLRASGLRLSAGCQQRAC